MDAELPCHQTASAIYSGAWLGHDVTISAPDQEHIFSKTYKGLQNPLQKGGSWSILNYASETISQPSTTLHPYNYP